MKTRTKPVLMATVATVVVALTYSQVAWSQDDELAASADTAASSGAVARDEGIEIPKDEDNGQSSGVGSDNTQVFGGSGEKRRSSWPSESDIVRSINDKTTRWASFRGRYDRALDALRGAKNSTAKADATTQLEEVLKAYFEEDIKAREEELEMIEARVKKLRDHLRIRREKMEDIIDLELQVAINEADGLGFFRGAGRTGNPWGFPGAPGGVGFGGGYGEGGYGGAYGAGGFGGGYSAAGGGGTGGSNRGVAPTPQPAPAPGDVRRDRRSR